MSGAIPTPRMEDPPSLTNGEAILSYSKDNAINDVAREIKEVVVTKNNARKGVEDGTKGATNAGVNMVEFDHAKEGKLGCAELFDAMDVEMVDADHDNITIAGVKIVGKEMAYQKEDQEGNDEFCQDAKGKMVEANARFKIKEVKYYVNEEDMLNKIQEKQNKSNIQLDDEKMVDKEDAYLDIDKEGMIQNTQDANIARCEGPYENKTSKNTINDQTGDVIIILKENACQKEDKKGNGDDQDLQPIENEDPNMVDVRANALNYEAKEIGKKKGTDDVTEKKQAKNIEDTVCIEKVDADKMDPMEDNKKELDNTKEIGEEKAPGKNVAFENREEEAMCKKGDFEKKEEDKAGEKGVVENNEEDKAMDLLSSRRSYSFDCPMRGKRTIKRLIEVIDMEPYNSFVVEKGYGTPLKNIPSVAYRIKRKKPAELKFLHHLLFGRKGKAADIKKSVLQFSGFACHENDGMLRAKMKGKLESCSEDTLSDLCSLLSIPVSKPNSKKEEIVAKLLDFIAKPEVMDDSTLFDEKESDSRKRKRDGERGTKNLKGAHKRSSKMVKKNEGNSADARKSFPSKDDLQKTIIRVLKKVDFKMTTYGDILKKLAVHYKMDLSSSKYAIKRMIQEEIIKSAPESSDD